MLTNGTVIITQSGKAKAVLQDIVTYEKTQEALALLKVLELGRRPVKDGRVNSVKDAFRELDRKIGHLKESDEQG